MYFSGIGNDSSLDEKSLTLGSTNVMAVFEVAWHGFKSHLSLHRHPESESWGDGKDPSDFSRNLRDLLLELGVPVSKWMFSVPDLLRGNWFVHLRLEKIPVLWEISSPLHWVKSFRVDFWFVHRFQLPQRLQALCHPSKFSPRTKRIQGKIKVKLSFQNDGFLTGLSQK